MKKIFRTLIAMVVAVMAFTTVCFASADTVEIRFAVGDDTLIINGESVQVEKPYVVGDGVTLVPVRVITEAFGAKVDWDQDTKTVKLDYPDVNIILQIDNLVAEVNGQAVRLESAPELTDTGFTMVPLRFISENFGAEVSYDHETAGIVVTKSSAGEGKIIEGAVENKYVGDSFYGWHMETPRDMNMTERWFDGTSTTFAYDENNWIEVDIYPMYEEYDLEEEFEYIKSYFDSFTITKAESKTFANGVKFIRLSAKDSKTVADYYEYADDTYIYCIRGGFSIDDEARLTEGLRIMSTFKLGYNDGDIYDLSNAKDGKRTYKAEGMGLSFAVPEEYIMLSDEGAENSLAFCSGLPDDDISAINVEIYSKESAGSAKDCAIRDHDRNKKRLNEDIAEFSEVSAIVYNGFTAHQYSYEIDAIHGKEYSVDAFFEVGEYVYNFHITVKLPTLNKEKVSMDVLNSIVAEEIDADKVGDIVYTDNDREGTYVVDKLNKCAFELPHEFVAMSESKTSAMYTNGSVILTVDVLMEDDYKYKDLEEAVKKVVASKRKLEGISIEQNVQEYKYGKTAYYTYSYSTVEDGFKSYSEVFITAKNDMAYVIEASYIELAYSQYMRDTVREIVSSIVYD